jgi:hypothetical protein
MRTWIRLTLLGLLAAAAAVLLSASPDGGPGIARSLFDVYAFSRAAAGLSEGRPRFAAPPPLAPFRAPTSPWRVGIQAGHWKIDELPPEQEHLHDSTGAVAGSLKEVDVNLAVARIVAADLTRAGVAVDLLPASVPAGYQADAFVAIHADGGSRLERGWKIAAPWRSSDASRMLRFDVAQSYQLLTGLPEDRYGVTAFMRGYYAFSWYRYDHAISPSTPAIIVEMGYITSAADRSVLAGNPESAALGISAGVLQFLGQSAALQPQSFVARLYSPVMVARDQAALRYAPGDDERVAGRLALGTFLRPLDEENGWAEVMVWGNFRVFGWVRKSDLQSMSGM